MVSSDLGKLAPNLARAATWLHRHLLWLLVASYVLAGVLPEPGLAIRRLSIHPATGGEVTAPLVLLALLLFCAAAAIDWSQLDALLQQPRILLPALIAIWIIPAAMVTALGWVLPQALGHELTSGMLVGLALVAAMPVANSSVAWCQSAGGNVALGLGLIIVTIVLSPVATPQMLKLMGLALSAEETAKCEEVVARFSGTFFIVWVILPSLVGMIVNRWAGTELIERWRSALRLLSAITLLTLNYANAALAMPKVFDSERGGAIFISALLAIALSGLGIASAWIVARSFAADRHALVALMFGLSMKHTGLALVLAGEVFETQPRVILMIVLATLLQHVVAGVADRWLSCGSSSSDP